MPEKIEHDKEGGLLGREGSGQCESHCEKV